MALGNAWGAPRIQGELKKLGFIISEASVSRYMPRLPPAPERASVGSPSCATTWTVPRPWTCSPSRPYSSGCSSASSSFISSKDETSSMAPVSLSELSTEEVTSKLPSISRSIRYGENAPSWFATGAQDRGNSRSSSATWEALWGLCRGSGSRSRRSRAVIRRQRSGLSFFSG